MGQWTKMTCSKVIRVKCKGYGYASSHCATKFIFMLVNFCAWWHQCYHLKKISEQPWICIYSSSLMYLLFLYSCF
jgi:hypothetical protein